METVSALLTIIYDQLPITDDKATELSHMWYELRKLTRTSLPWEYISDRVEWLCLVPTSTNRFPGDLGYRMAEIIIGLYKENVFFMNNDSKFLNTEWRTWYSLTNFEDHFGLHTSGVFLNPNMCGFLYMCMLLGSQSRTNCLYHSTRLDLYSHQILLELKIPHRWVMCMEINGLNTTRNNDIVIA